MKILAMLMCSNFILNMNPTSMVLMMFAMSAIIMLLLSSMYLNQWIIFMIILTFTGGLMILFTYIISIFPNYKTSYKNIMTIWMPITLSSMIFIMTLMKKTTMSCQFNVFSFSWSTIIVFTLLLMMIIFFTSKIILNPFKSLKSA